MSAHYVKSNDLGTAPEVVCMADSFGDQAKGQTAMENCLQKNVGINLVGRLRLHGYRERRRRRTAVS